MSQRLLFERLAVAGLAVVVGLLASAAIGLSQPPPTAEAPPALHYRRIFVPQTEVDRVVRGLLPMKRDEFDRRIQQAQEAGRGPDSVSQVRINSAEYRARLVGDSLVDGQAELTIAHSSSGPAILLLEPANLALHSANWLGTNPRAARYGVDPTGKLACLVEEAGTLSQSWSLAGERDERGGLVFRFRLPPGPRQKLRLALPSDLMLTSDQAIVTRGASGESPQPAAGYADWTVEASGSGEIVLKISKPAASTPLEALVLAKEQSAYTVQRGAIDLETSFELDVLHRPLTDLVLACDKTLEIVAIRLGESSLPWSPLAGDSSQQRIAVRLAPPLQGKADPIRVSATAKWNGRADLVLPRVQLENATWQQGRTTVAAEAALPLRATARAGCRLSSFTPASALRPSNQWQFQQFAPGAHIRVALDDAPPLLEEFSATALDFGPTQIAGVYSAEISVTDALRFELQAEIPRTWIVDSVDVQPADALADRSLGNRGSGPQILKLALRRPIAEDRPLHLVIRAHRSRPLNDQAIPPEVFAIARLADVRSARRLLAWRVTDPAAQLTFAGDESLHRLDASQLTPAELRLFDVPPATTVLELDAEAAAPRARLLPTSPRYQAEVLVRAEIDREDVRETWRIVCTPQDAAIGRLLVHCRPLPAEPGRWRITGEDPREITVRPLHPTASIGDEGMFEVTLARPRQTPLEITAEFHRRRTDRGELPLVTLPSATSQTGHVELHSLDGRPLALETQGLRSVAPSWPVESPATLRGTFRYDLGRVARLSWHVPAAGRALPTAWIRSLELTSRCTSDGTSQHEAVWTIENRGHDRLEFQLPPGAQSVQAKVADQPVVRLVAHDSADAYSVPLPAGRQCVVLVTYATRDPPAPWYWSSGLVSPLPRCALPILNRTWQLQLAPGLELATWTSLSARRLESGENLRTTDGLEPGDSRLSEANWTRYEVDPARADGRGLWVCRTATITAWSWCLALAMAAVVVRVAAGRWAWLVLLAGCCAAAACVVPQEFAALALGSLAGLGLGAGWLLLVPRRLVAAGRDANSTSRSIAGLLRPAMGANVLLALAVGASLGQAPQPPAAGGEAPVTSRVVIPVDDAQQPVGDYVFLEPAFYDALLKLTDRASLNLPDWLLTSAVFRPVISADGGGRRIQVDEVGAILEIEALRADTTVELGFRRDQIHFVERRARLDGEALLPEWSPDGARLRIPIRQAGKHRLELVWGAPSQVVGEYEQLEFAIPRAGVGRVELPASAALVEIPAARGATVVDDASRGRTVHLGQAGQLALRWPAGDGATAGPARVEAEQLLLWAVRPGSVVAEGKLRLRPLGGTIREIAVEIDPRLRLLPAPANQVVARQWIDAVGPVSLLRVALTEPAATDVTVPISLLWAESSGIGNLALPQVMVRAEKVTRAWSGLALGSSLQWKPPPAARPGDPTSDEFAAAWSAPLDGPVVALDAALPAPPALFTQLSEPRITARQVIECGVSSGMIQLQYSAALSGLPADAFQHKLQLSSELRVTKVQVLSAGAPIKFDWLQAASGELLITQHAPPTSEQELKLTGQVAIAPGQRTVAAPLVDYIGAADRPLELRVYRQPDVQVSAVADEGAWAETAQVELGQFRQGMGRLAAAYLRLPAKAVNPPALTVQPNLSVPLGTFMVRLVPGETQWSVEIDTALDMESGLLDALRLELPAELELPVTITPAVEHEIVGLPGQAGRLLTVRPQKAIDRSLQLSVRGQVRSADMHIATLPAIALRGAPRVRHLVALPVRLAGRRIEWETSGLQAIDSATLSTASQPLPAGYELFEAVAPRPTAVAQLQTASSQSPLVQLAAHQLQIYRGNTASGRSRFDLLARGARQVELAVPPGSRLIHVAIEDVPAQLVERGAGRWRLPVLSDARPQRIEVVYSATLTRDGQAGAAAFHPPRIEGAAIDETRWQIDPDRWSERSDGAIEIPLASPPPRLEDRRLGLAGLALLTAAMLAWLMTREPLHSRLRQQSPLLVALAGVLWLFVGIAPWLGWILLGLAVWLAIRAPWPRAVDQPLSSVLGRSR